jgi:acylphosphatase
MIGLHLRIHGRVQGVGYRAFAVRAARRWRVRGWVRNAVDGAVEAQGTGEDEALRSWVEELRRGPGAGLVTRIEETPLEPAEDFVDFAVRW